MIGNKKGWTIAAGVAIGSSLIALVVILPSVFAIGSSATSATMRAGVLELWNVSKPISSVVDSAPIGSGNAGDDYARAIRILDDNEEQIKQLHKDFRRWQEDATELTYELDYASDEVREARIRELSVTLPPEAEQIRRHIAQGAGKEKMEYIFIHTPQALHVDRHIEASANFRALSRIMMAIADYHILRGEPAEVVELLQNMGVMGWHMFTERAHVDMMYEGLVIQADAVRMLQYAYAMLEQDDKFDRARAYQTAVEQLLRDFDKKLDAIMPPRDEHRLANPGDVFNVVRHDQDRAWRVQGILALGVLKVQPPGVMARNDERVTRKLINENLDRNEPLIRAAAVAARDLTLAEDKEPQAPEDSD